MELRILGSFEVYDASGNRLRIPAGRERALLVALLLRRGEVVSVDALVDALWGERPPSSAAKAVQGYVSHMRRLLGDEGNLLVTQPPGYVLRVADDQVDAFRFERLAAEGQRALEDDDPSAALRSLDAALALWRGEALAEFAFDDFAQRETHRLADRLLEASEDRVDALLQLGRHRGLVPELEALVAAHPLRGRLRGQLMLALYRSGRPADALQVYKDGARLSRELGLDPAAELRALEKAILDQDPALAAPPIATTRDTVPPPAAHPAPMRRRTLLAAVAVAALAALAVVGVLAFDVLDESAASVFVVPPAVAVVDPETNRVVASLEVGPRPVSLAEGSGAVWVGDGRDSTVSRIDPRTRTIAQRIGIGASAVDLATGLGSVWVATGGSGEILRIDPEVDAVTQRFSLGSPNDLVVPSTTAVGAGREGLWIGAFDGLVRLDPRSGRVVDEVDLGAQPALSVAVGGGAVWATTWANRVQRIEASTGAPTAAFYAGAFVLPVAVARTAVWAAGEGGLVWKLSPVTAAQLASADVTPGTQWPHRAEGLAIAGEDVWVTSVADGRIVRIDGRTGVIEATLHVDGSPFEALYAGGLVWVTVLEAEVQP